MKWAIFGDVHGKLRSMYEEVSAIESANRIKIDTVLQVGDFHCIRDEADLRRFPAPERHKQL